MDEITNRQQIPEPLKFILAGKAYFTLKSVKTGTRYTYKVTRAPEKEGKPTNLWFVKLLTGPENSTDYTYIGCIYPADNGIHVFKTTQASKLPSDSTPCKAIDYTLACLSTKPSVSGVEIWHSGRCGRCGRLLTVPESIASGFGPECIGLI